MKATLKRNIAHAIEIPLSGGEIAELFWSLDETGQAAFFNTLYLFGRLPLQLQAMTDCGELSLGGRHIMRRIGEYASESPTKTDMTELIEQVKAWGVSKGITGPNGKATLLSQLSKTQEELTETRDAAVALSIYREIDSDSLISFSMDELKDGIGDTLVTLILAAELAGLTLEECLEAAYNEIKDRTGSMQNGQFIKD